MAKPLFGLRNLLLILALWVVVAVVFLVVRAPFAAAERLECVRYVILVVNQHVKLSDGTWPKGWEDLERVRLPEGSPEMPCGGIWPHIRGYVRVDFKADAAKLADRKAEDFEAIQPKGSCGEFAEDVETLLATIRSAREAKAAEEREEEEESQEEK